MGSDSVIKTLRDAVGANPDDVALRLHLAGLLLESDILTEAEDQYHEILKRQPANIEALARSVAVATALGKHQKAQQYEQLLNALAPSGDSSLNSDKLDGEKNSQEINSAKLAAFPQAKDNRNDMGENKPNPELKLKAVDRPDNITVGPWEEFEPPITLADVGGMQTVKKRLNIAFLAPLKNPELMRMYGKSLKGGMMLYGPPGCGKTFIARALAGELGAKFMSIGLSDVLDMWMGESERKLHEVFEAARRNAPTVLFFDEIDALGQKRSQLRNSAGRNIVNQLLAEMDSVGSDNKNVFILAATNHPWDVDTALRRPGRFDRIVLVLPPDEEARAAIVKYHMQNRPVDNFEEQTIAANTDSFSGADLAHLCESAVEYAMEDSLNSGNARAVCNNDFTKALQDLRPSTRPWFETARNYAMFANEGGVYDDLLDYIRMNKL